MESENIRVVGNDKPPDLAPETLMRNRKIILVASVLPDPDSPEMITDCEFPIPTKLENAFWAIANKCGGRSFVSRALK